MIHDYEGIQFMMRNLADYFRYSVRTGFCLVPLEREMSFLHSYLNIMSLRYDGCFSFSADIAPDVEKLTSLIESGQEVQDAIAQRYDDDLEKRSKRRRNKKKGIIEIPDDNSDLPF